MSLRRELNRRANYLHDARILINFLEDDLLNAVAGRCSTNGDAAYLAVRCVLVGLITNTVARLVVGRHVIVCRLILVDGRAAVARTLNSLTLRCRIRTITNSAIVRYGRIVIRATIDLLLGVGITSAAILMVDLLRAVRIRANVLTCMYLSCLNDRRILIVNDVITRRRLDLDALFRRSRRAAVRRRIGVQARGVSSLGNSLRLRIL